jgi:hypothetical protein
LFAHGQPQKPADFYGLSEKSTIKKGKDDKDETDDTQPGTGRRHDGMDFDFCAGFHACPRGRKKG